MATARKSSCEGILRGTLQLIQQELLCNVVAAEYLSLPSQLFQIAVATASLCYMKPAV